MTAHRGAALRATQLTNPQWRSPLAVCRPAWDGYIEPRQTAVAELRPQNRHIRKSRYTQRIFPRKVFTINEFGIWSHWMSVRSTIVSQFEQVATEQKRKLSRLSDDLKLLDAGLDSLSLALIVVRLEEALGFDPFDVAEDVQFPVTFGDFVRLYENHRK
jgi:acyl carrier protein